MKLSEAMRLGAMLHPQCFGSLYVVDPITQQVRFSCALGAALGAGYRPPPAVTVRRCPACGAPDHLARVVMHLNDDHRWTRERIADWVAMVEPAEPEVVASAVTAPAVSEQLVRS